MTAADGPRLLLVVPSLRPAGAEHQLVYLAIGLKARGYRVTLACVNEITIDPGPLLDAGVRLIRLGAGRRAQKLAALPRLVRLARSADVVHCTLWDASLWGRLAAILARRPVVVTEHASNRGLQPSETSGAPRGRWISLHNRWLEPFTAATVVVAREQIPRLVGEGVGPDRIVHIPNGTPVQAVIEASRGGVSREDLGLSRESAVLIHAARLVPLKNQRLTLETMAWLAQTLARDVRVLIVGPGRDRETLEQYAAELGVEALFLGFRSDVPALMALADLVVLPSVTEAMPMTLIEAMAVGVPVVATAVGDVGSILESTGAGIPVPAGDPDAFRRACLAVLEDSALSTRLAQAGRRASMGWDAEEMVSSYAELFDRVLRR